MVYTLFNEFTLSKEGRAIIYVKLKPFNSKILESKEFKIDTGADLSTISKGYLIDLGYSKEWINKNIKLDPYSSLSRAGGEEEPAYFIQIANASILGLPLINWAFYIIPDWKYDFSNLLGINILLYFKFYFDYTTWKLNIRPERNPLNKLPLLLNQEVGEIVESASL